MSNNLMGKVKQGGKRTFSKLNEQDKVLTLQSINSKVVDFQYAVRGAQAIRAEELKMQLKKAPNSLPFQKVIACNIGNPQQLQQKPITFFRQVASLCEYPELMSVENQKKLGSLYPKDVIKRAKEILDSVGGSIGAYSHSQGIPLVRERVANFLQKRDGFPANADDIFLTAGASPGVQSVLQTIITDDHTGVMIPIPQYPLYTAAISMWGGSAVEYYLDEKQDWTMHVEELEKSLKNARSNGLNVRALCVINPGNPTGQCLTEESMQGVIKFCKKERMVLMADEVYQTNIYQDSKPFLSFKKVLKSMGDEYNDFELISFHSISKGVVGECGRRGAFYECVGIDEKVKQMLYKIASVSLCPPVSGQILVENMVNPPKVGDDSYPLYQKEYDEIINSLKRRAVKLAAAFNSLEGVSCNNAQGAMYLFPQIKLPKKAIDESLKRKQKPDEFYCMELLNNTGVCVIAGSGFGQQKDTYHFRSTFLPAEGEMDEFIGKIKDFHNDFMKKFK